MTPELRLRLEACDSLPTPPGVAIQLVALANDRDADVDALVEVFTQDPAITAKLLRMANSPLYAQQRPIENLRRAIVVLGADAAVSFALSFSLVASWQKSNSRDGLDYPLFWRRSLLSAAIGRLLAEAVGETDPEGVFVTCLMQDIGMMAIARSIDGIYGEGEPEQIDHEALVRYERERLGADHAAVGAWLLESWHLPDRISRAVGGSHEPHSVSLDEEDGPLVRCVGLAGLLAEAFLDESGRRGFEELEFSAKSILGMDAEELATLMESVSGLIPELEAVFETQILADAAEGRIMNEARVALDERTRRMAESSRIDSLTGLPNRRCLDDALEEAFRISRMRNEPLSVAFVDLDNFKALNDSYGHRVGDQVLATTAGILQSTIRSSDIAGRYGGEEFVLVFPKTGLQEAQAICEEIIRTVGQTKHHTESDELLSATVSIGIATDIDECPFDKAGEFISAADQALYRAKLEGRNRTSVFEGAVRS